MLTLPFPLLPGAPALFNDYCANTADAGNYFMGHFSDLMAYETHLQQLEQRKYLRERLYSILAAQNKKLFASEAALKNLELFKDPGTYVVMTGQQVGLFTGPLYTIYKAMTAVKLASWLREQFPAYRFIPMFWLECEDHDFVEINNAAVLDRSNAFTRVRWAEPAEDEPRNLTPIAQMHLDESIRRSIDELFAAMPETEFTADARAIVEGSYAPGTGVATAFARMLTALFPGSGLVFVDPSDPELKQLQAPIVLQELETFPTTGEEVIKRSAELEERYHAQIKPRAVNLFLLHKNNRYPIEPSDYGFFLKGTRQRFTRDELLDIADKSPESFSPNVLLRPVIQDFLFPTVAYVAGPSEVSYFAQLQPAYDHFQVPMPIIFPRSSISIVEKKVGKIFQKYGLPYSAMFASPEDAWQMMAETHRRGFDFDAIRTAVLDAASALPALAADEDANLTDPASSTLAGIERSLQTFEEKLFRSRRQQDEVATGQIGKMLAVLSPEAKPQERQLNILHFYNRYGSEVLGAIESHCQPFPSEHRLLFL